MIRYHRLELLRRALMREGPFVMSKRLAQGARSALFGQHRLVFALSSGEVPRADADDEPEIDVTQIPRAADVEQVMLGELARHPRLFFWGPSSKVEAGGVLWIARWNGVVASVGLTRTGEKVDTYFFPMTRRCVLISHCVTMPGLRGRGIYVVLLRRIVRELACSGVTRFYIDCTDYNVSSARSIERAGFHLIGHGIHRRSGRVVWFQKARPAIVRLSRPALEENSASDSVDARRPAGVGFERRMGK